MTKQLSMAKRMINACICAYQIHNHGWKPTKGTLQPTFSRIIKKDTQKSGGGYYYGVTTAYQDEVKFKGSVSSGYAPEFFADGTDDINGVLVGAMTDNNIVVALRGTIPLGLNNNDIFQMIHDWYQDFEIEPKPWPPYPGAEVSKGFGVAAQALWPWIKKTIDGLIKTDSALKGVVITGHSKGAAMTFLVASLIDQHYPQFKGNIDVHAFAAPVTGDNSFAVQYNASGLSANTHRYQVEHDLVPFMALWPAANFYTSVLKLIPHKWEDYIQRHIWERVYKDVQKDTHGGYDAVGDFTYFNSSHALMPGAQVATSALPDVVTLLAAITLLHQKNVKTIGAAHSATDSYLPCFQKY